MWSWSLDTMVHRLDQARITILSIADIPKNFTEVEASFWGSVVGSSIGVIGAFGVGLLAIVAERRFSKRQIKRGYMRSSEAQIIELEFLLNQFVINSVKNTRLIRKCLDLKTPGHFMKTLPRTIPLAISREGDICNQQIGNEFLGLKISAMLSNHLIEDFVNDYKDLSTLMFPIIAQGESSKLEKKTINAYHDRLLEFAEASMNSSKMITEKCIRLLALVRLYGINTQNSPFNNLEDMIAFKIDDSDIEAHALLIASEFDEATIFKDL